MAKAKLRLLLPDSAFHDTFCAGQVKGGANRLSLISVI